MREIIFRGQTRRLGEKVWMNGEKVLSNWAYGGICQGKGDFSIIYGGLDVERENPIEKFVVYTDTVGQYTGLTDKNGKKIFEGDICKHRSSFSGEYIISVVTYTDGQFLAMADENSGFNLSNKLEIIGNIHDNPELLKDGAV